MQNTKSFAGTVISAFNLQDASDLMRITIQGIWGFSGTADLSFSTVYRRINIPLGNVYQLIIHGEFMDNRCWKGDVVVPFNVTHVYRLIING